MIADFCNVEAIHEKALSLGIVAVSDASFGSKTTYRVGGNSKIEINVASHSELLATSKLALAFREMPLMVAGNGSNMLVSDQGYFGFVVRLSNDFSFTNLSIADEIITIGGSTLLPIASRRIATMGYSGFEWGVGIPGALGGAIRMNAGGHGSGISQCLMDAQIFDFADPQSGILNFSNAQLQLKYRQSVVKPTQIVMEGRFRFKPGIREKSFAMISEIVAWRRANQPGGQNAGSVFVNPPGVSAGKLIEDLGLKGCTYNSALVSLKHANFIQSKPDGRSQDVLALMAILRDEVAKKCGVRLRTEIRLVGFQDDLGLAQSDDY